MSVWVELVRQPLREQRRPLMWWVVVAGPAAFAAAWSAAVPGGARFWEGWLGGWPVVWQRCGCGVASGEPSLFASVVVFQVVAPLLLLVFASAAVLRIYLGEVSRGSLGFLMSLPVTRWRLVAARVVVFLLGLAVMVVVVAFGFWSGVVVGGGRVGVEALAGGAVGLYVLFGFLGGLGFVVSLGFRERVRGLLVLLGVQLTLFVLGAVWGEGAGVLRAINPYSYYGGVGVLSGDAARGWGELGILAGAGVVLWVFGGLVFVRKQV